MALNAGRPKSVGRKRRYKRNQATRGDVYNFSQRPPQAIECKYNGHSCLQRERFMQRFMHLFMQRFMQLSKIHPQTT